MRAWLLQGLLEHADDPNFIFMTGDLGFNFLEPLKQKMGARFINAGVAEQNMVSVAAGLAREGLRVYVYSISPFLYARAYEQIRIDVCLNRLPVQMIGSGAGFDYGSMGPEHHALEDYGTMTALRDLKFYLPWCESGMTRALHSMWNSETPGYLRLDRKTLDYPLQPAVPAWHQILSGNKDVFLCIGSTAIPYQQFWKEQKDRPTLWAVDQLPWPAPPKNFLEACAGKRLFVIEEHVATGGAGEKLSHWFYNRPDRPREILSHAVSEVFSGLFGNRDFHWRENSLLPEQLKAQWLR